MQQKNKCSQHRSQHTDYYWRVSCWKWRVWLVRCQVWDLAEVNHCVVVMCDVNVLKYVHILILLFSVAAFSKYNMWKFCHCWPTWSFEHQFQCFQLVNEWLPLDVFPTALQLLTPCGFWACKNRPSPYPGQMSQKATKRGLALSIVYLRILYIVLFIRVLFMYC